VAGPGFGNSPGTPAVRALVGVSWGGQRDARCAAGGTQEPALCPALDFDGDGVTNRDDACPELAAAGRADGCPARDADGDGTEDALDACPAVAGVAAAGGCPRVDGDGDGVEDGEDRCPNEAGPQATQGCAVRDADGDGHPDEVDACPREAAETGDGCPVAAAPGMVSVKDDHLELKAKVFFDTAKPTLQARSFPVLNEVAEVLKAHPELGRFFIDGHTDSRGPAAFNQQLSLERARAVRAYLVRAGVDGERLEARGFGATKPVATNATDEGREVNRRVEFNSRQ
jgi:outer membrane protein OmpA-like peptidoglycan-associated protein